MRPISFIAFAVTLCMSCSTVYAMEATPDNRTSEKAKRSECSIEELEKLIVPLQAMHPPATANEVIKHDRPKLDEWSIWDAEFDTPMSIIVRLIGRYGEAVTRVAFLNRHDYVMSETVFDYPDNVYDLVDQKRAVTVLPGVSHNVFFCADRVRLPAGTSAYDIEKWTTIGNNQRAWFFDEPVRVYGLDLGKIPQN